MNFKVNGFRPEEQPETQPHSYEPQTAIPRKSLVDVRFPGKGISLTYYNDQFDLHPGDRVYVEGKEEGQLGQVTDISYNFKIKPSAYKRVIAVADTDIHGQFYLADAHFLTFSPEVLPPEKVLLWFKAPEPEEEIISSCDDFAFSLNDLKAMNIRPAIAERGYEYYTEDKVRYLCVDGSKGFAIVEGRKVYTVEFQYKNGQISQLLCDCPCTCTCKHGFAAMLQLQHTIGLVQQHYSGEFEKTGFFAAIVRDTLLDFAIDGKRTGSFTL